MARKAEEKLTSSSPSYLDPYKEAIASGFCDDKNHEPDQALMTLSALARSPNNRSMFSRLAS